MPKFTEFQKKMMSLGFSEADATVYPRIIMSVSGREKSGKTHFALSAPDPIAFFSSDIGTEGVVNKFKAAGKDIWTHEVEMPETKGDEANEVWKGFKNAYYGILRIPEIRTVILDTSTEIWELLRIYKFGKLTEVMPFQYGPVNSEFRKMLKKPYDAQKNLILLQKMKPVYINDKRTSDYEFAGFSDTPYLVQVNLEVSRTKPKRSCDFCKEKDGKHRHWCVRVNDCRQNPDLIDKVFTDRLCSFPFLASMIIDGTGPEDWE